MKKIILEKEEPLACMKCTGPVDGYHWHSGYVFNGDVPELKLFPVCKGCSKEISGVSSFRMGVKKS